MFTLKYKMRWLLIILSLSFPNATDNEDFAASKHQEKNQETDETDKLSSQRNGKNYEEIDGTSDLSSKGSVLILYDEWEQVYNSTSSLNHQLMFLADHAGFTVYKVVPSCNDYDMEGVESNGIHLTLGNHICGEPNTDCLQFYSVCNFSAIENIPNLKVIFGHIPVTSTAAISLKEKSFQNSRIFLFVSDIPEAIGEYQPEDYEEWESLTIKASEKADVVFSVGPKVFAIINKAFEATSKQVNHFEYLPFPESDYFDIQMTLPRETSLKQIISYEHMIGSRNPEKHNLFIATAFGRVSQTYRDTAEEPPFYIIKGVPNQYHNVVKQNIERKLAKDDKYLKLRLVGYGKKDRNKQHLKQSNLVLLSSRSEAFGMPALEAMAAGVPVLATGNSGLAQFIRKEFPGQASQMIVNVGINDRDVDGDIDKWRDRIIDVLRFNYTARFEVAQSIKVQLKESSTLQESRERFVKELRNEK